MRSTDSRVASTGDSHLRVAAANVLLEQYVGQNRYADQIRMLEVIAVGDDPSERVRALLRAAEVSDTGTQDIEAAFGFAGRALREGVDLEDLERVLADYERYAEATGRYSDQVATLGTIAAELLDADLRTKVRMRAAAIAQERLQDADFARAQYQRVLDEQPSVRAASGLGLGLGEARRVRFDSRTGTALGCLRPRTQSQVRAVILTAIATSEVAEQAAEWMSYPRTWGAMG